MNNILKRIDTAKHIVVSVHVNPDADSIGSASAFYTYLLTLHKKVSFFCYTKNINQKLSFIPWFDKIRDSFPSSCDLAISFDCADVRKIGMELDCDLINIDYQNSNSISITQVLFNFFVDNKISINKKMATALYAGLLDGSNGLVSDEVDGTTFAMVSELIKRGAEYKLCNNFIMKYQTLASLKLKAVMLSNMTLLNDAKIALFLVSNYDMRKTGAIDEDCESALKEALFLPTVEVSILIKENLDLTLEGLIYSSENLNSLLIASKLNGSGNSSRAVFMLSKEETLENASKRILKLVKEEI